ncbi:MAG: alanine racemase [Acidimicrobiales bacterium]
MRVSRDVLCDRTLIGSGDPQAMVEAATLAVGARLAAIRHRIEAAGGSSEIQVVAVTKGLGPWAARAALAAGLCDIGENYADELLATRAAVDRAVQGPARKVTDSDPEAHDSRSPEDAFGASPTVPALRWHFLGRIQRNKVARLSGAVACWQSVDRLAAAQAVAARAPGSPVLLQVNITGDPARPGCAAVGVETLVGQCRDLGLEVAGLMAVGSPAWTHSQARANFSELTRRRLDLGLGHLSAGMSGDLEAAVSAGSTMVRIGRDLFGPDR